MFDNESTEDRLGSSFSSANDSHSGPDQSTTPVRFDRYQVLKELGRGGFGRVELAYDPFTDRLVAIKRVKSGSTIQEAKNSAKLKHPGIVAVFDVQGDSIIQEWVVGTDLRRWMNERTFSFQDITSLIIEIAEAVDYAHEQNVIHCDLKPENILINESGHAHVADFGLAIQGSDSRAVGGTIHYMAPEQARIMLHRSDHAIELGRQTDVWAIGVILYELLSGEHPFNAPSKDELLALLAAGQIAPRPPSELNPRVPMELEHICLNCLMGVPHRYQTAEALAADLRKELKARGNTSEWKNTPNQTFNCQLSDLSTQEASRLFAALVSALDEESPEDQSGLAVLAADCAMYLHDRRRDLSDRDKQRFQSACSTELSSRSTVTDDSRNARKHSRRRHSLGLALGRLGRVVDPRDGAGGEDYAPITTGEYVVQGNSIMIDQPFQICKFPVTNGQFQFFLEGGGYLKEEFWSTSGWNWKRSNNVSHPRFWYKSKWNGPNQPVVGVSFWEAEAYCRWLGGRLPDETEWEAAAGGPNSNEFPWGNQWTDGICNSHEAGLAVTSPVGSFPQSQSEDHGLQDMSGNVREWCDHRSQDHRAFDERVLRGGSWYHYSWDCKVTARRLYKVGGRFTAIGFRVVMD